jgi:hypothetical protein
MKTKNNFSRRYYMRSNSNKGVLFLCMIALILSICSIAEKGLAEPYGYSESHIRGSYHQWSDSSMDQAYSEVSKDDNTASSYIDFIGSTLHGGVYLNTYRDDGNFVNSANTSATYGENWEVAENSGAPGSELEGSDVLLHFYQTGSFSLGSGASLGVDYSLSKAIGTIKAINFRFGVSQDGPGFDNVKTYAKIDRYGIDNKFLDSIDIDVSLTNDDGIINFAYDTSYGIFIEVGSILTESLTVNANVYNELDSNNFVDSSESFHAGITSLNPDVVYVSESGRTTATGPAPVPEPATMFLFGSGLIGLAGFRKMFKKS